MKMKSIAVFCGSSAGNHPIYVQQARKLGETLAAEGITLVYGGATVGCMGAVADAVMEAGGKVIGVIPQKLVNVELAHEHLTKLHVVETMHERKALMADNAEGFIALPGGTGTLEEWFEAITWAQLGYHHKPCGLLNINDYYTPLIALFDHMIEQGFVKREYKELILIDNDPANLIEKMRNHNQAHFTPKWE
jgi:uncharacterized protein (TIGR00730 family)